MAYTTAAVHSDGKGKRPKLTDFVLRWTRTPRQTQAEQLNILKALAARQEKRVDDR